MSRSRLLQAVFTTAFALSFLGGVSIASVQETGAPVESPQAERPGAGSPAAEHPGVDRPRTERPVAELLEAARRPGPWEVATLRERDGIRNGPAYRGGTIHYPVGPDGGPATLGRLPIMAICPGYQASEGSVRPWGRFLASHGIVTMTLGTNARGDQPPARGRALLDAIETVRAEDEREGSPLRGRLDRDRAGVAGWSMGGGGAQHAAVMDGSLKGVVAMVPWQPGADFDHAVPVLILAGQVDRVASTRRHAQRHYDATPEGTTKLLFEIRGGNHYLPGDPGNHAGEVGAWTLAWVKAFVAGEEDYRAVLDVMPSTASLYRRSWEDDETVSGGRERGGRERPFRRR